MQPSLGRYQVGRLLGVGASGQVYEALLIGPGGFRMPVALKVLHGGAVDLRREARIGGLLRHRNLVDVYEIGEADGQWYCALERCDSALSAHMPLPPRAVVEAGLQVCAALQYAHEELGLVHQDLKPANLLVSGGTVKVADLGIASARGFSALERIHGTVGYMPPEQARGGTVDARTDIWALGVTLAELATGASPNASGTLDLDSLDGPPTDARPLAPVPDWLAGIVERCLAPDPEDRWPDMESLARALAALKVEGPGLRQALGVPEDDEVHRERAEAPGPPLLGRDLELERVAALLREPGLVTLKGPAGIGKSRLAAAIAEHWAGDGDRAFQASLVDVDSLDDLLVAVGSALGGVGGSQQPDARIRRIGDALAGRGAVLLVLDNFEQIVPHAPVVARWLARAPEARVVVTSREPLRIAEERVFDVEPLSPEAARALLVERARDRGVEIADDPDLPELARRLDGLPLALELAAGRLGVLTVRDVLEHLGPALLRSATSGRHGTLTAALDWSWDLLGDVEKSALAQLSVFTGGFLLPAAEDVLELGGASALDVIGSLVDRSMVRARPGERFDLLASVQQYASERLDDPDALVRHGRWCVRAASEEALAALVRGQGLDEPGSLLAERDNMTLACRRAVERGDPEVASDTLRAAWLIHWSSGPSATPLELARSVLAMPGLSGLHRVRAELTAGTAMRLSAAVVEAEVTLTSALAGAVALGDRSLEAATLDSLGTLELRLGRVADARQRFEAALTLRRGLSNRGAEATSAGKLGLVCLNQLEWDAAQGWLEQCLAGHREAGNHRAEAVAVGNLGLVHAHLGRRDEARACYEAAVLLHRRLHNHYGEASVLQNLGNHLRLEYGDPSALALYQRAVALCREIGDRLGEGHTLGNLAMFFLQERRLPDAKETLEAALAIDREVGNHRSESFVLSVLGAVARHRGDMEASRHLLEQAVAAARMGRGLAEEVRALGQLAEASFETGRLQEARTCIDASLAITAELAAPALECTTRGLLAILEATCGDEDAAREQLRRAEILQRDHVDPTVRGSFQLFCARTEAQLGHLDRAASGLRGARATVPPWRGDLLLEIERTEAQITGASG